MSVRTLGSAVAVALLLASIGTAVAPTAAVPTWLEDTPLSAPGSDASEPQLVATSEGVLVALWYDDSTGHPVVLASSRAPGDPTWTPPAPVSDPGLPASGLRADSGPEGGVTAVWVSEAPGGGRVETATAPDGVAWSAAQVLSDPDEVVADPDLDVGANGRAAIVWTRTPPPPVPPDTVVRPLEIPLSVREPGSDVWVPLGSKVTRTTVPFAAQVAVDGMGDVTLVWRDTRPSGIRLLAGYYSNRWYGGRPVVDVPAGTPGGTPGRFDLDAGFWSTEIAYEWVTADHTEIWRDQRLANGFWSGNKRITAASVHAVDPHVAAHGTLAYAIVWRQGVEVPDELKALTHAAVDPVRLGDADEGTTVSVTMREGQAIAAWDTGSGSRTLQASVLRGDVWTAYPAVAAEVLGHAVAMDPWGNAAAAWSAVDAADTRVSAQVLDADGPLPLLRASRLATGRRPVVPLRWRLPDWPEGAWVKAQRMRVRGIATEAQPWRSAGAPAAPATSMSYPGAPGRTYCFQLRGTDQDGGVSPWSQERCTTTAIDDRAATNLGWTRAKDRRDYQGTITRTAVRGEKLTFKRISFDDLWLLARTTPRSGKLDAYFGSRLVATVSLRSDTTRHRVAIPLLVDSLAWDPGSTPGDLRLVTRSARPVMIDGVYAVRLPPQDYLGAD